MVLIGCSACSGVDGVEEFKDLQVIKKETDKSRSLVKQRVDLCSVCKGFLADGNYLFFEECNGDKLFSFKTERIIKRLKEVFLNSH